MIYQIFFKYNFTDYCNYIHIHENRNDINKSWILEISSIKISKIKLDRHQRTHLSQIVLLLGKKKIIYMFNDILHTYN